MTYRDLHETEAFKAIENAMIKSHNNAVNIALLIASRYDSDNVDEFKIELRKLLREVKL